MISTQKLKDAERVVRITMILILLTAGSSKIFSDGAFFDYYFELFQSELRINLPSSMVDLFLSTVPFIELTLGLALLSNKYKNYTTYAWLGFMLSLMFGHYILQ